MKFELDLRNAFGAFDELDNKTALDALGKAGSYAMRPVLTDMKNRVHKDTLTLYRSLGIKTKKMPKNARDSVVRIRVGMVRKTVVINKKKHNLIGLGVRQLAHEYGNKNFEEDSFIRDLFAVHKSRIRSDIEAQIVAMILAVKVRKAVRS